ncbi:MAG: hypothetical protein QM703_11530 [Gemmatales bacterium]
MNHGPITIVHMSDLHIAGRPHVLDSDFTEWRLSVLNDVRSVLSRAPGHRIVILTGGITFSGQEREHKQAIEFIGQLQAMNNLQHESIIAVPGRNDKSAQSYLQDKGNTYKSLFDNYTSNVMHECDHFKISVLHDIRCVFVLFDSDPQMMSIEVFSELVEALDRLEIDLYRHASFLFLISHKPMDLYDNVVRSIENRWISHRTPELPKLVMSLSGHEYSSLDCYRPDDYRSSLCVASRTSFPDHWEVIRRNSNVYYNIIRIESGNVFTQKREYHPLSKTWSASEKLSFDKSRVVRRTFTCDLFRDQYVKHKAIHDAISKLSKSQIDTLLADLGVSVFPYLPSEESQSSLSFRLINHFMHSNATDYLMKTVQRILDKSASVTAFVGFVKYERRLANDIANAIGGIGLEVCKIEEDEYADIDNSVLKSMYSKDDLLVIVVTKRSSTRKRPDRLSWRLAKTCKRVVAVTVGSDCEFGDAYSALSQLNVNSRTELMSVEFRNTLRHLILRKLANGVTQSSS